MVILPTHSDRPPCRAGAVGPTRTGLAVLHRALHLHDLMGAVIHGWCPASAGRPTRARGSWLLPIALEVARINPWCGPRVPLTIGTQRTEPIHTVLTLAGDQQFSVEVARIDARRAGQQPWTFERPMDTAGGGTIADGPSCSCHRCHEVERIVLAGRGHMDVIPPHDVVGLLPNRASTSYGERINSPDGGIPSCSVRPCMHPVSLENCWTHTRRHVSTAGTSRHQAGAWKVYISDHKA